MFTSMHACMHVNLIQSELKVFTGSVTAPYRKPDITLLNACKKIKLHHLSDFASWNRKRCTIKRLSRQ